MRAAAFLVGSICVAFAARWAAAAVPVVESTPSTGSTASSVNRGAPAPAPSSSAVRAYGADTAQIVSTEPMDVVRTAPPSQSVGGAVGSAAAAAPVGTPTGSSTSILIQQLQQLQDEVAELRGTVEEQAHQIQQLKADQKEQYLDIDRRLSAVQGGAPAAGAAPTGGISSGPTGPVATTSGPTGGTSVSGGAASNSERDAYTRAFNLTKDKRFAEAISAFNEMLVTYPKGEYAGNAYYWLGEMYRATGAPEKARQSFAQVVNQYPNNPKISDAMYKLGVVYNELGDRAKALEYLKRVQSQFPGTSAASLAQSYAAELH